MNAVRATLLAFVATTASLHAGTGVYVWRIQPDPDLPAAIRRSDLSRILVLASEIAPDGVVRRGGNLALAKNSGAGEIVPVIRVARTSADFATDPAFFAILDAEIVRTTGGRGPVQLDFDCPQRRLADYAALIDALKTKHPGLRISVTGMPCWLDEKELPELLARTESWTLQIHLTDLPRRLAAEKPSAALCDTARARTWIASAAKLGRPFRVAVPTYGYLAHYDESGNLLGLETETGTTYPGSRYTLWWTPDFAALATLVRENEIAPAAGFRGFDWYRFPQSGDRFNLSEKAFAEIRRGEAPRPAAIVCRIRHSQDGRIADLSLVNDGGLTGAMPATVAIVADTKPETYDLPDAVLIRETDAELVVAPQPGILLPGERRALGWVRLRSGGITVRLPTP